MAKYYTNRIDLKKDTEFIYDLRISYDVKTQLIDELFESWKNHSPDSPWFKDTSVKISKDGKSNQWCGEHTVFNTVRGKHKYNLRNN
tara:strand:+ start:2035 stop:2295 length:261 start_codon:yes stop_codon:yes gene_type:complete